MLALHLRRSTPVFCAEHAVETDGGLQVCARARQLQHHRAAEAEARSPQAGGIDLRRPASVASAAGRAEQPLRLGAQAPDDRLRLPAGFRLPPLAEHVGG
jgi:hypothetical protein